MAMKPYPLRFEPAFRDYIWGGRNLASKLNKPIPQQGVWAESWELVDHPDHDSIVVNGALRGESLGNIVRSHGEWLLGKHTPQPRFPLLLKYLDCQNVLSVQVNPNDQYAARMTPPDLGKTEAWFVVDALPDAVIYAGLKRNVDRDSLRTAIEQGNVAELLHIIYPKPGDCLFIPAGTVHALGAGLLVAEIQQASNTTFRLFDWNRVDAQGKSRPLHVEQALQTIDFESGPRVFQCPQPTEQPGRFQLVSCDKFVLECVRQTESVFIGGDNRFHIVTVTKGRVELRFEDGTEIVGLGESVLLPAALSRAKATLSPDAMLLDMFLP